MEQPPSLGYRHEQNAPQWIVAAASLFAIVMFSLAVALIRSDDVPAAVGVGVVLAIGLVVLTILDATRLTTIVTPNEVTLYFRLGWPRRAIDRARIVSAQARRNSWLAGWGIRLVPGGWMWNVWGLDAVELELDTGRKFRIGTDDAEGLLAALRS